MSDSFWRKPKNKSNQVKVLKKARDHVVGRFLIDLDHRFPYTIKWDNSLDDYAHLLVQWDTSIESTSQWSNKFGCVATVCQISRLSLEGDVWIPGAKVELGCAVLSKTEAPELEHLYHIFPTRLTIESKRALVGIAITTTTHFLSRDFIKSYATWDKDKLDTIIQPGLDWHPVSWDDWSTVVGKAVETEAPSEQWLKQQRKAELDGIG